MMPSVRVATLMCVYGGDRPQAFEEALLSVLGQELDAEVESRLYLGVDGPLQAAVEEVIRRHAGHIHKIVRSPENRGLAATLNALIASLEDEQFVFRMDADDRCHPSRYRTQLAHLARHETVDILGTDIVEVDETTGARRVVQFPGGSEDDALGIARRVPVAHPTVCFRRSVLDRMGGYPLSTGNEDIALWFACLREGFRFDNVRQPLLEFRITAGFWKRRSLQKAFRELVCYARGIWATNPWTWRYVFPCARFGMRLAPRWVSQLAYALPGARRSTSSTGVESATSRWPTTK